MTVGNRRKIWIKIRFFLFKKMNLELSPAKWQPFVHSMHCCTNCTNHLRSVKCQLSAIQCTDLLIFRSWYFFHDKFPWNVFALFWSQSGIFACTLSYYHHQIGMTHLPSFRVTSWNNGMRCMCFCILINSLAMLPNLFDISWAFYIINLSKTHSCNSFRQY